MGHEIENNITVASGKCYNKFLGGILERTIDRNNDENTNAHDSSHFAVCQIESVGGCCLEWDNGMI